MHSTVNLAHCLMQQEFTTLTLRPSNLKWQGTHTVLRTLGSHISNRAFLAFWFRWPHFIVGLLVNDIFKLQRFLLQATERNDTLISDYELDYIVQ